MRIGCGETRSSCVVIQLQQKLLIVAIAQLVPGRSGSGVISTSSGKVNKQLKEEDELIYIVGVLVLFLFFSNNIIALQVVQEVLSSLTAFSSLGSNC